MIVISDGHESPIDAGHEGAPGWGWQRQPGEHPNRAQVERDHGATSSSGQAAGHMAYLEFRSVQRYPHRPGYRRRR
jgi:hypothetical protein